MTMKTELIDRLSRLIHEGDEQRLARIKRFIHHEEAGADESYQDDEDLDTMQGYAKEENEQFLDECEQAYQNVVSGKDRGYSVEEAKEIIYGRKPIG